MFFSDSQVFISVGRQTYQKGFWHLIKAFKLVNDQLSNTILVIIGADHQNGKVSKLINDMNLQNSVLVLNHQENPFMFIKNSSVYVLSSIFEGFPNAMVEALACGCPVIAADCMSGPREILYEDVDLNKSIDKITNAQYGILIPALESKENWNSDVIEGCDIMLYEAMKGAISSEIQLSYYSEKSIIRAEEFNFNICKLKFKDVIQTVCERED